MATNITSRHLNQDKRTAEALVVTVPAIAQERGGRTLLPPIYYQFGEVLQATVLSPGMIIQKAYVVVEEAFPASTTVTVAAGGTALFTDLDVTSKGINVSTSEDEWIETGGNIEVTFGGGTGDTPGG